MCACTLSAHVSYTSLLLVDFVSEVCVYMLVVLGCQQLWCYYSVYGCLNVRDSICVSG